MKKTPTPEQIRTKARRMILLGDNNVNLVIDAIEKILISSVANMMPLGKPITILKRQLVWPDPNGSPQTNLTIESALETFKTDWEVVKHGKIKDENFFVTICEKGAAVDIPSAD